ncbi:MAG TPA: helix-turn-helix transcriptional regulator [Candidatus Baltobacteraceae bacterium]|nr:helix-turn-helix transcriptional regulator [Candidatus Baltobacteraceae bacterium]
MDGDFRALGGALRAARKNRRLTLLDVSRQLGISVNTLSRAENGGDVRLNTLAELARVLDLEIMVAPRRLVPTIRAITSGSTPDADSDDYREDPHEAP